MLRILRIIGIVIFALLIGFSSNALYGMHESGQLLEKYNSSRKANITLLGVSVLVLGVLSFFELTRLRRLEARRQGYGRSNRSREDADSSEQRNSSIYAAPETIDDWQGRRTRGSKSRTNRNQFEVTSIWVGLLRVCCLILPILYAGLLAMSLMDETAAKGSADWLLPTAYSGLIVLSLITSLGVVKKRAWGMSLGYVLAICNLLVFPIGTAIGLLLLMGLVGSTSHFAVAPSERRRTARKKAAKKVQAVTI